MANYAYDADGNRYSASNLGTTTSYVVDTSVPYASVVEEYAGASTTPSARYDYGDDLVRMDRGGVYYYIYDGLGSTRQLVNTVGAVTDTWGYSAFGELASHTGSTVNPFLFNAQQFDGASGNYYLRARYYDQSVGRFISQDPFEGRNEDPISLHRYLYASVDPMNRFDPGGRDDTLIGQLSTLGVNAIISTAAFGLVGAVSGGIYYSARFGFNTTNFGEGAITGGELGLAFGYARAVGRLPITTESALIGGTVSVLVEGLADYSRGKFQEDFIDKHKGEKSFIEGLSNGAITGALGNVASPFVLATSATFLQDLLSADKPIHQADFIRIVSDSVVQGVIAQILLGVVPDAVDADSFASARKVIESETADEVNEQAAAILTGLWGTGGGLIVGDIFDTLSEH